MSFYRSDDMQFFRLIMPRDSAWATLNTLGKHDLIHVVKDKNPQMVRPFAHQVKRCEESLLKIRTLEKVIEEKNVGAIREFMTDEQYRNLDVMWQVHQKTGGNQESRLTEVEQQIDKIWKYQQQLLKRKQEIHDKLMFLRENIAIIKAGQKHFGQAFYEIKTSFFENPDHASIFGLHELQIKAIVTEGKSISSVMKTVNRISRGNSFVNQIPYEQVFQSMYPGEDSKSVIFIVYPAKKDSNLDKKIVKLIQNYCKSWQSYILPQSDVNFLEKKKTIDENYEEAKKMYDFTEEQDEKFLKGLLDKVEGKTITLLEYYKYYLLKQREIYTQMNEMAPHSNFIDAEIFVRKDDVEQTMELLHKISAQTQMPEGKLVKETAAKYPTHFQLNTVKAPFQMITNTYGIPQYKQANPSLFSLVTFPFLFGVMFGDIAHGLILFTFGLYLVFLSEGSTNSFIRLLTPFKYTVTLMGFFATYSGFIYNDFLSISLNLFGSCFNRHDAEPQKAMSKFAADCVYPFGVDPIWSMASNSLNYINSLKMKISVIIAVVHMTLGVFVKASNALYFNRKLDFIFEFLPQVVFMVGLFGYMDFLIVYKWLRPWKLYDQSAPSIITTMINLPLKMGKTDKCCGGQPMWGSFGSTNQDSIQFILLVLGVICVPLMLLPKPIIEIMNMGKHNSDGSDGHQQHQKQKLMAEPESVPELTSIKTIQTAKKIQLEREHDAGQIFVHQLIETIEYVLGCISNTASYLRLWALSLAHSQLSEVFFQKTVEGGLSKGHAGIPILLLGFPILAGATFGVLLCMDSMECFLHTLRLHWVEFQNKFYKGDGFQFTPLSFKTLVTEAVAGRT